MINTPEAVQLFYSLLLIEVKLRFGKSQHHCGSMSQHVVFLPTNSKITAQRQVFLREKMRQIKRNAATAASAVQRER